MIQLTKHTSTPFLRAPKIPASKRTVQAMLLGLVAVCLIFTAANANAACGMMGNKSFNPTKFPYLVQTDPAGATIVGMWQVTYTVGNTSDIFNQTLDQWHSDGTEFENADLSPLGGNICMGVWKQIGPFTVRLHHIGLTFSSDGLDATGSFTLDEVNTVASNGKTYTGTFTFKTFDTYGNYSGTTVTGKITATRVTVQ